MGEALGLSHAVGDRALSCLLTAREPNHFQRGPGPLPGLGLVCGYALVTFPVRFLPFSSASLGESSSPSCQRERWSPVGVFYVSLPLPSPWPGLVASREQVCLSLTPAWVFRLSVCFSLMELLGPGDPLWSYMRSHLILSPSFNGHLVWQK